jgi:thiol-disulfide isomerase/thioredoxin
MYNKMHPGTTGRRSLVFALLLLVACSGGRERVSPPSVDGNVMYGQSGMAFVLENFSIFRTRTELVTAPDEAVEYLRRLRDPIEIKIFMGTWCTDSQLHVPVLFKAVQEADNNRITVRVIAMDRRKQDLDGMVERYDVALSPTFVVEHDGIELGRVIETPIVDAATDVVTIIRNNLGG